MDVFCYRMKIKEVSYEETEIISQYILMLQTNKKVYINICLKWFDFKIFG